MEEITSRNNPAVKAAAALKELRERKSTGLFLLEGARLCKDAALNGVAIEKDGKTYNFGDGIADVETRLTILAAFESTILGTYNYIPMLQNAGMSLLSQQVYYVIEEYNPVMGRGGIKYMKYNYDDAAWAEFVASQENGQLSY